MYEAVISLTGTAALLLGSPGPAPLALAAIGATFGVRRGLYFYAGNIVGLCLAIFGAAIGLAALFATFPRARLFMQILGAAYILFVAVKIASAPVSTAAQQGHEVPKFIDGLILNLLNPKGYAVFLAIFSQFLLPFDGTWLAYLTTAMICLAVAAIVDFVWLCFGGVLGPVFTKPTQARTLRVVFAILMVVAVIWALAQ